MVALSVPTTQKKRNCLLIFLTTTSLLLVWLYALAAPRHVRIVPIAKKVYNSVQAHAQHANQETLNLTFLDQYGLSSTFTYRQRTIKSKFIKGERAELTVVKGSLFDNAYNVDRANLATIKIDRVSPLVLPIPVSLHNDPKAFSFGIATDVSRLNATLPSFRHWLANTSCPIHVLATQDVNASKVQSAIREEGVNLTITDTKLPFPQAYFHLIKELYDTRQAHTEWLVLLDDDTFVPSLSKVVEHIGNTYNSTQETLVAALSDDWNQVKIFGMIPFGGGGIFISVPLAARLTQPKIWGQCAKSTKDGGDQIVNDCVNDHTNVRPLFDPLLNQMDIRGEGCEAGYFESGRRMLTIHHWKSWFHHNIPEASLISKVAGTESILMRFLFSTSHTVLSNGYSIVEYPQGFSNHHITKSNLTTTHNLTQKVTNGVSKEAKERENTDNINQEEYTRLEKEWEIDLSKVERTWLGDDSRFLHRFPLRPKLDSDKKVSYKLVKTEVIEKMGVRQIYVNKATDEWSVDGVMVLIWLF